MDWKKVDYNTLAWAEVYSVRKYDALFVGLLLYLFKYAMHSVLSLSLVGFNDAFNLIRLFQRPCLGRVQTDVLSGNHKTKSAVLFKLLTQT